MNKNKFIVSLFPGEYDPAVARVKSEEQVSFEQLSEIITKKTYCLIKFKKKYRNEKNFESSEVVGIDYDKNKTLEWGVNRVKSLGLSSIVGTTRSHQKLKNGEVCDRYRILVKLSKPITDVDQYRQTVAEVLKAFPGADPSPKDAARLFFPCKEIIYSNFKGKTLSPCQLYDSIKKQKKVVNRTVDTGIDPVAAYRRALKFLKDHPPAIENEGGDKHTFETAAAIYDQGIAAADTCADLLEISGWNERCEPPWEADELLTKCENALLYRQNDIGVYAPELIFKEEPDASSDPLLSVKEQESQVLELVGGDWRNGIERTKQGTPKGTLKNVVLILKNAVDKTIFKRDLFAFRDFYGCGTPWGGVTGQLVSDDDVARMVYWLGTRYEFEPRENVLHNAITVIATDNGFHPVREKLEQLLEWDGVSRLDSWLVNHFQAEGHNEYLAQVFRKWMVAAIARVFRPGVKFDWMIIFEGLQGVGKSSFGRLLVGDQWFLDWLPDLGNKDAALALQGIWAVEMAELSTLRKNEIEMVKGFVTRTIDKVRPPYGRRVIEVPRQCVFYGTTNREEYLLDDTGNRRFKPVKVGQLDFLALERDREQLWAEALFIFNEKLEESFELSGDAKIFELEIQEKKMVKDEATTMSEKIMDYIEREKRGENETEMTPKIDWSKFKILDLFRDTLPLHGYKDDRRNTLFAVKAVKILGGERLTYHAGRYWNLKRDTAATL